MQFNDTLPLPQLSRTQLLSWINTLTNSSLTKIQQLGTGISYCQIIDFLHPRLIHNSKMNPKAKTQYQFINNFKLLQQCFAKLGIYKNIEIEKLVKCKYQDNLEFLQWFQRYFEGQVVRKDISSLGDSGNGERRSIKKRAKSFLIPGNISKIEGESKGERGVEIEGGSFEDVLVLEGLAGKERREVGEELVEFYKGKLMEIQELVEKWDGSRLAGELKDEINEILLRPPKQVEVLKDISLNI